MQVIHRLDREKDHEVGACGILAVGELFLKKATKSIAWVAVEYEFKKQKFGILIGVDLSIAEVLGGGSALPSWMSGPTLSGTLYFGNKPWALKISLRL